MIEYLDNSSVSAFLGALFAFLLVIANESRKRNRSKRTIVDLVDDLNELAHRKIESVRTNIALIREDNKFTTAPFMQFPLSPIKHLQLEVLDLLNANEKAGLDAILYWAESIDGLLNSVTKNSIKLYELAKENAPTAQRAQIGVEMIIELQEAENNLKHFFTFCEHYTTGKPHKILEFQHPVGGGSA